MSDRFLVATRKGMFRFVRQAGTTPVWKIDQASFVGDPVTMMLHDARTGTTYAALNLGHFGVKMHRSEDDGDTWTEIPAPRFEEQEDREKGDGPSVDQVWILETGGNDQPGRLWAGTLPGALFASDDGGASWSLNRSLWDRPERDSWFGGGYDDPGIHSICVDPRNSSHVRLGVSCGGVWETVDDGKNWILRCDGMFAAYMPPERREDPAIQDPHRIVQCAADPDVFWVQHHNGVFKSEDGAATWTEIPDVPPAVFGFAVAVHPADPQTAWFIPAKKDECRIPVDGQVVVARTRDGGRTFDALRDGLPQDYAYDLVFRHALDIDSGGDRLTFGSTTGSVWVTENQGDSWHAVSHHLPPVYAVRFLP